MWAMQGEINIRIPLDNSSLAGSSAVSGKIINIHDAYKVNIYYALIYHKDILKNVE